MAKILERTHTFLQLPSREIKPRYQGMSILIDNGIATQHFLDVVDSHSEFIDFVKFGWCTSLIRIPFNQGYKILFWRDSF
jgi:phosphosulfolactate synthase